MVSCSLWPLPFCAKLSINVYNIACVHVLFGWNFQILRVTKTAGDPSREVLKDSSQDLMLMCQHVRSTFDQAVASFKNGKGLKDMKF